MQIIDKQTKKLFGSWTAFAKSQDENHTNFKRKILQNINRLNKWLNPIGLEIKVVKKTTKN